MEKDLKIKITDFIKPSQVKEERKKEDINLDDSWDTPINPKGNSGEVVERITKLITSNYHYFSNWDRCFETILDVILYALTNQEKKYLELVSTLKKEALAVITKIYSLLFNAFCIDYNIYDYLGSVYMQISSISKSKMLGQNFTPFNVASMMCRILISDVKKAIKQAKQEKRVITLNEPCIGSGVMFLAMKDYIIREVGLQGLYFFKFTGQDIDSICVKMAKIQLLLTDYHYMSSLLLVKGYEIREKIQKLKAKEKGDF